MSQLKSNLEAMLLSLKAKVETLNDRVCSALRNIDVSDSSTSSTRILTQFLEENLEYLIFIL